MSTLTAARALCVVLALGAGAAQAQFPNPGDGFEWERVGDFPVNADFFGFDDDHRFYAGLSDIYRLDLSGGWPGVWIQLNDRGIGRMDGLLILSPDSLLGGREGRVYRSTDGAVTWSVVNDTGDGALLEVPSGFPHAGRLLTGSGDTSSGFTGAAYSDDRGATWTPAIVPTEGYATAFATLPPSVGAPSGRLLFAGLAASAGAYSDDGGTSWTYGARPYEGFPQAHALTTVSYPEGIDGGFGARALWLGYVSTQPHVRCWTSDDGGASWQDRGGLPQPDDGVGGSAAGVLNLGGASALAVLGRGILYRTDDGGQTWVVVGRTPDITSSVSVQTATLGPDGRLYIGLSHTGPTSAWAYRTQEVLGIPVTGEPAPPAPEGLGVTMQPNPLGTRGHVAVRLPEATDLRVVLFDLMGRQIAVLSEGRMEAGLHRVPLDVAALAPGVYVARVTTGSDTDAGRTESRRVVIAR